MKNNMISLLISLTSIAFLTMCVESSNNNTESTSELDNNYKSYYYPINDLKDSKVYHYTPDEVDIEDLYWVLSSVKEKGKRFLITDSYIMDSIGNLKHVEVIKEEINKTGAYVKQYTEFQYNENGDQYEVPAEVNSECVFKWDMQKDDTITWSFETESKLYPGYVIKVDRNRNYNKQTTNIQFKSKDYNAIIFSDNFKIEYVNSLINDKQEVNYSQTSYYAEEIGLYKFVRVFPDRQLTHTLTEILTLTEWDKLKNRK